MSALSQFRHSCVPKQIRLRKQVLYLSVGVVELHAVAIGGEEDSGADQAVALSEKMFQITMKK